ncbi:Linoleate 10R-lipoxygenase [Grifola frondosa]|uniref:Linoleate 10R-lipoxygenase n=1 Tax=Grifola frondosa TaxID=5627 RepID=A0A1C7MAM3_GRIFR|nr:Linoleate 10R-lipoxygenase [Grifola frondosa]
MLNQVNDVFSYKPWRSLQVGQALPSKFASLAGHTQSSDGLDITPSPTSSEPKVLQEFRDQVKKGVSFHLELATLGSIVDALKHPDGIDDRKMLLEYILVYLSKRPPGALSTKLQNTVVQLHLGKAGTPYARSVQQIHAVPGHDLPDPGLVFDTLLKREAFVKHPAGLSSMMFSFAALVIHTVFRTSHQDVNINDTSSYIDLAPLYGHNQEAQDKIRVRDGRGLLSPDSFAEDRLLLLPPAVCVLLVLFSRNHNYIARKLLEINERGIWQDPDTIPSDAERTSKLLKQEEEIFQIARLNNCAWFANIVFSDYFCAILGLVRDGSSWSLDPFGEVRGEDHALFERGRGNVCSVEFNCLYRWHATTSVEDEQWIKQLFDKLFQGESAESLSVKQFKEVAKKMQAEEPDVHHWTFGNLQRQEDLTFNDAALASVLQNATEHPAGAFKARGTPAIMRLHEIMGIKQNREWGVCSLNDFRKFLGLKTYSTFLEWNPNPEVATAAEKLYGHIDRLELYVGLQAEDTKQVVEGAGLCPSYTISRAILSDAIALTRGDRFFTADYTPFNMTAWGFADCQKDPNGPGNGSMLGRLLLRTLPEQYTSDSSYTWFPLMTPEAMEVILTKLGSTDTYDMSRPRTVAPIKEVSEYVDVAQVLVSEDTFNVRHAGRAARVVHGQGFFIASDNAARGAREQRALLNALINEPGSAEKITDYFYQKTRELMLCESYTCVASTTRNVDIVRDVLKFVPLHWACELAGIKLKTSPEEEEGYTPQELFDILGDIYSYLFLDVDAGRLLGLQKNVAKHVDNLLGDIRRAFGATGRLSIVEFVEEKLSHFFGRHEKTDRGKLMDRFHALGYLPETLCNSILAVLVGATVELSQSMVHVINFYLDDNKPKDVQHLVSKVKLDAKDDALLQGFVNEALRLDPTFRGVYRESSGPVQVGIQSFKAGQQLFVDIAKANLDPQVFADPSIVNPSRGPIDRYLVGDGAAKCLGLDLSTKIIAQTVRAVFGFSQLRRAPGDSGKLKRFAEDSSRTSCYSYLSSTQQLVPWATSMVVQFD